jgi:LemA protein
MGNAGWIILAVLVLLGLWLAVTYNGLVTLRQRCRQAFSDIDVQLKQRHDLIPNLVETVKGYAAHERGTLDAVVQARNSAMAAHGPAAQAQAEGMLQSTLRQLFALAEAYPDLKANQNFQQLQAELSDLENKIAAARRFFNNAAAEYLSENGAARLSPITTLPRKWPDSLMPIDDVVVLARLMGT